MRKFLLFMIVLVPLFGFSGFTSAQAPVQVDFFYSPTCPYCAKEKVFLQELADRYPAIKINRYDIVNNQANQQLLVNFYQRYEVPDSLQGLVPATFTPTKYFIGFDDQIAKEMESCLVQCFEPSHQGLSLENTSITERTFRLPFFREVRLGELSFPVMAVVLGALDGFNVCSLGALLLVLSLVLAFKSRKKILLFGGTFILTTALAYGFLIFFWYKLFEVVAPYLQAVNIIIGVLGVGGGLYFAKQFFRQRKQAATCESGPGEKVVSKFMPRLQSLLQNPSSVFLAVPAVFAFAFLLTVVEFPCSAVVPVAFAAVLAKAGLPSSLYILYMALYVVFYLLDEIIVFAVAALTSKIWFGSPKFLKWMVLAEAVILFSMGFYYLFNVLT